MFKKINKKGFTLAELLIVVAIIGVLVAISIPIFTAQLTKAKKAANLANARSIYAQLTADYLEDESIDESKISGIPLSYTNHKATAIIDGNRYEFTEVTGETITITYKPGAPKVTVSQDGTVTNTFGGSN